MEVTYLINGFKYKFVDVRIEFGVQRGYCPRKKKWAFLYPEYIQFDGEGIVLAKPV